MHAPLLETDSLAEFLSSPLLREWVDPCSKVRSFLLDGAAAPFQQSFYFVSPSFTDDGRYYWFYCAFPPSGSGNYGRCLGVADFVEGTIRHYPDTQFHDSSPLVDRGTGEVYWCNHLEIWKRGPKPEQKPVLVNRFPAEVARQRHLTYLATHLTFSADRRALSLDAQIGRESYVGHIPLDGSPPEVWKKFDRRINHVQFSPADPDLQLIAQDYWTDPATGEPGGIDQRMWLLRRGGEPEVLYPGGGSRLQGHEWWSADGRRVWYIHYHHGVEYIDIEKGRPERVWPLQTVSHAHVDAAEEFVVADFLPGDVPEERRVAFLNRSTRREIDIVSHLPLSPQGCDKYHVHPHPQFCWGDRLICYTTTVRGRVDVAFAPVGSLVSCTAE